MQLMAISFAKRNVLPGHNFVLQETTSSSIDGGTFVVPRKIASHFYFDRLVALAAQEMTIFENLPGEVFLADADRTFSFPALPTDLPMILSGLNVSSSPQDLIAVFWGRRVRVVSNSENGYGSVQSKDFSRETLRSPTSFSGPAVVPASIRRLNRETARAAEDRPPREVLDGFGMRRGAAWEEYRRQLARLLEGANARPDPVLLDMSLRNEARNLALSKKGLA